eukprot:COSAG06_NODE_18786_length_869_cov_1.001299_2_plen_31_part_01
MAQMMLPVQVPEPEQVQVLESAQTRELELEC